MEGKILFKYYWGNWGKSLFINFIGEKDVNQNAYTQCAQNLLGGCV